MLGEAGMLCRLSLPCGFCWTERHDIGYFRAARTCIRRLTLAVDAIHLLLITALFEALDGSERDEDVRRWFLGHGDLWRLWRRASLVKCWW